MNKKYSYPIRGAFVRAQRVIKGQPTDIFLIKLSSINSIIQEIDTTTGEKVCFFWTYKDCCYFVPISIDELQNAINSFIFEPNTHWENFGH